MLAGILYGFSVLARNVNRMVGPGSAAYGQGWIWIPIAACVVVVYPLPIGIGKILRLCFGVLIFTISLTHMP